GVAIAYNGKLIHESYASARGITANTPLFGFSATKSVLGLGLGIARDDGAFKETDKLPVPSWGGSRPTTWLNVLHQDSGIKWVELPTASQSSNVTPMLFQSFDQAAYVASLPQNDPPGTTHLYSTGNSVLLTRMLENLLLAKAKLPNTPANSLKVTSDFFQQRLFAKARVSSAVFQPDEIGTFGGGSYLIMKTRDWLRLGQLVLDHGRVGNTQVVSADWIDNVMAKPSPIFPGYGGHLWLGKLADKADECSSFPDDAMWFSGYGGQKIIVVPSRKVVFARLGLTSTPEQGVNLTFGSLCKVLAQLPQ
ncbi:MAG TPA: serine hydrolase, partial [Polyangiales bacterium]